MYYATLLCIHASGAHIVSTAAPAAVSKPPVLVLEVFHPLISAAGSSEKWS